MAIKRVVVTKMQGTVSGDIQVTYVFRYLMPSGMEVVYADSTKTSSDPTATPSDESDVKTGTVFEETGTLIVPVTMKSDDIKALLVTTYQQRAKSFTTPTVLGSLAGVSWDGTTWS